VDLKMHAITVCPPTNGTLLEPRRCGRATTPAGCDRWRLGFIDEMSGILALHESLRGEEALADRQRGWRQLAASLF
jgi:hypothetical protein